MKLPATGGLTGRAIEEWAGSSPDAAIPARVKLRVFERHMGVCFLSGVKIKAGDQWDCDHRKPLHAGGQHRESNLVPVLRLMHRAKTADEMHAKAKVERTRKKHLGIFPQTKHKIKSRGFQRRWQPTADHDT